MNHDKLFDVVYRSPKDGDGKSGSVNDVQDVTDKILGDEVKPSKEEQSNNHGGVMDDLPTGGNVNGISQTISAALNNATTSGAIICAEEIFSSQQDVVRRINEELSEFREQLKKSQELFHSLVSKRTINTVLLHWLLTWQLVNYSLQIDSIVLAVKLHNKTVHCDCPSIREMGGK